MHFGSKDVDSVHRYGMTKCEGRSVSDFDLLTNKE